MFIAAQVLSAFVMIVTLVNAISIFYQMFNNGADERNTIPYLAIMIITALAAMFIYIYFNYLL
uniref:Uncharacterized protein n=1 Tax=Siphoviridae sp. ctZHD14 TaxID=2827891 RepID=A0A8S5SVZ8_9CAUD|nr:MAG TPA: hypothetical protein [Siphoviridae sp. ctZHD14]